MWVPMNMSSSNPSLFVGPEIVRLWSQETPNSVLRHRGVDVTGSSPRHVRINFGAWSLTSAS